MASLTLIYIIIKPIKILIIITSFAICIIIIISFKSRTIKITFKAIQWKSRTFLAYRIESNRIEPNRIKHGFAESELFQYFDVFMSSVRSNRTLFYCIWMLLHDVFDGFEWFLLVRFDRTELEKTSKYFSVRFDSVRSN